MRKKQLSCISLLFVAVFVFGCEGFLGTKTGKQFLGTPSFEVRPVAYVPILPVMQGFQDPVDVFCGFDELIYIVDAGAQQIIVYDYGRAELGRINIPGVKAVTQDLRLQLLAIGTKDTLGQKFDAIYRIRMDEGINFGPAFARITKTIIHPFYFSSNPAILLNPTAVRFNDIAILGDNRYYVARSGTVNTLTQFGGPDDAILQFDQNDTYLGPILISSREFGNQRDFFRNPVSIVGLVQPPQRAIPNSSRDFIVVQNSPDIALKVQYVEFVETSENSFYTIRELVTEDFSRADRFLYDPNRFASPQGSIVTGDGTNYLFVADSEKDSVYQFTLQGLEGVIPPPGSVESKNILASFGGSGIGVTQFDRPVAVGYTGRFLLVVDRGNRRVLTFRLSTDFQ